MSGPEYSAPIVRHKDRVVIEVQHTSYDQPVSQLTYRQSTQWHEVLLAGPAINSAGTQGNSFPGMYYYHPATKTEWVVTVEGPVDWRTCRLGVTPQDGVLELGLFSTQVVDPQISLKVWHSPINEVPSQWQALNRLMAKSFTLLPLPAPPDATPDWTDLASRCFAGLGWAGAQHPLANQLGGVAYQSMWDEFNSFYAKPKPFIELIAQASIARSLARAARNTPNRAYSDKVRTLVKAVIPRFFNSELGVFENAYPGGGTSHSLRTRLVDKAIVLETWYALSNLSDILDLCRTTQDQRLTELAAQSISAWIAIGQEIGHIFPLFLNVATREGQGGKLNVSTGGLYADVMLSAAALWPRRAPEFKAEAAQALTVMRRFPVQRIFHQPEMLARATDAAYRLAVEDPSYKEIGDGFLNALVFMMYRDPVNAGLFEGCAGMMYPTFRESVASLMTLATLARDSTHLPVKDICDLGLAKCYRFLKHLSPKAVLPLEGLSTKEVPYGPGVGIAVYAAGGVFDLAYIQRLLK